jgi:hypothetical protein
VPEPPSFTSFGQGQGYLRRLLDRHRSMGGSTPKNWTRDLTGTQRQLIVREPS